MKELRRGETCEVDLGVMCAGRPKDLLDLELLAQGAAKKPRARRR